MEEEKGTPTSTEETEETQEESTEESQEETQEQKEGESLDEYKARLKKAEELANNYKIRAEKAEKKAKEVPKETTGLSHNDVIFLAKADVHEDDMEELTGFMSKMGMTAKEAYDYLSPRFAVKAEERKTAAATGTKSPRGTKPTTGEDLLDKAEKTGELPDTEEGMQKLILARQARFKKQ